MTLDLLFMGLVVVFGIIGFFSGFWMQVVRLVALVSAYLLAGLAGKPLGPWLGRSLGIPTLLGTVLGAGLAFLLLYTIFSTVGWTLIRRRDRRNAREGETSVAKMLWERLGGAGLGGAKVFLVLYMILCMLVLVEKPLAKSLGSKNPLKGSFMAGFAREHNLLAGMHLPAVRNVTSLGKLATEPGLRQRALKDPAVRKLLDHPKIRALANDRALIAASRSNDIAAILANPHLNRVLEDPEVRKLISEIDLQSLEGNE